MEYLQSIGAQTGVFLRTVGFGFLLGAAYDLLRILRLLTGARRITAWDVGFGAFAGTAAFLYALTQNGGKVRVYLFAAIGVGAAVWYSTAGKPIRSATDAVLRAGRRAASFVRRPFVLISARFVRTREHLSASAKKAIKSCKKNRKPS